MPQALPFSPVAAPPLGAPPLTPVDPFMGVAEVLAVVNVSRSTLWNWRRQGKFPRGTCLGGKLVMWRRSVVEAWMAAQERGEAWTTGN